MQEFCVRGPAPPIFHMLALGVGIGGNANFSVCVGGNANFSVFRYQHVGIPKAKLWRWGSKPMQGPNTNGFASQWNIGLYYIKHSDTQHCLSFYCDVGYRGNILQPGKTQLDLIDLMKYRPYNMEHEYRFSLQSALSKSVCYCWCVYNCHFSSKLHFYTITVVNST